MAARLVLLLLACAAAACGRARPSDRGREAACEAGEAAACASFAAELDRRCAGGGEAGACSRLAVLHLAGRVAGVDRARAVALYEKACTLRDGAGCREAAALQPETPRAAALLQAGCDHGDGRSCHALVAELRSGDREPARAAALFRTAVGLYEKACAAGSAADCMGLGRLYGSIAPSDEARAERFQRRAVELFTAACDRDDAPACFELGMAYHDGAGVEGDVARHHALMERSCRLGHAKACAELAGTYATSEAIEDDAQAPALFERACLAGVLHRQPCREAGFAYVDGRVVPADKAKGARLLERSCALGDAASCWMLAGMLREGDGVPADERRAAALLGRGAGVDVEVVTVERAKQAPDPAAAHLGVDPGELPPVKAKPGEDLLIVTFDVRRSGGGGGPLPVRRVWVVDAEGHRHASVLESDLPFGQVEHERREMVFVVPEGLQPVKVQFQLGALSFDLPRSSAAGRSPVEAPPGGAAARRPVGAAPTSWPGRPSRTTT